MANKSTVSTNSEDLQLLTEKLKSKKWIREDYMSFCGFTHSCNYFFITGKSGSFRCGINDNRVFFKYSTGSRLIVEFNTRAEALDYWLHTVGIEVIKLNFEVMYSRNDIVELVNLSGAHEKTQFVDPIGRQFTVLGTFLVADYNGLEVTYTEAGIHIEPIGELFTMFRGEQSPVQSFAVNRNDLKMIKKFE